MSGAAVDLPLDAAAASVSWNGAEKAGHVSERSLRNENAVSCRVFICLDLARPPNLAKADVQGSMMRPGAMGTLQM